MQKPSMESVLSQYGIKLNRNKKAPCPFHSEKTASLSIKGHIFNCFGCGKKGDGIDFVMMMEGCTFPEALEILKIGNTRETKEQIRQKEEKNKNDSLYWKTFEVFALLDNICVDNTPAKGEQPNEAWIIASALREIWWDELERIKIRLQNL